MRLPQPLSAAVAFYDESTGTILDVKPLREVCSQATGVPVRRPAGLGQWTSEPAPGDTTTGWARFPVATRTGAVVATSFRPRCGVGTPPAGAPCLNPSGWVGQPIDTFCRQASGAVKCYDSDGAAPRRRSARLHFVRGYPTGAVGASPPEPKNAYLTNVDCPRPGTSTPSRTSAPRAALGRDRPGSVLEDIPPTPPDEPVETRLASNVEVRYKQVRADGTVVCDFGPSCSLQTASAGGGTATFSTQGSASSPHLPIASESQWNAVALEIRLKGSSVSPADPDCSPAASFSDRCRWFYTGTGNFGPDVAPTPTQVLASPIQRSFMGDLDRTGAISGCGSRSTRTATCSRSPTGSSAATPSPGRTRRASPRSGALTSSTWPRRRHGPRPGRAADRAQPRQRLEPARAHRLRPDDPEPEGRDPVRLPAPVVRGAPVRHVPPLPRYGGLLRDPEGVPVRHLAAIPPCSRRRPRRRTRSSRVQRAAVRRLEQPALPGRQHDAPGARPELLPHRDNNDFDDETFAWDGDTPNDESDDWGNELRRRRPQARHALLHRVRDSFTGPGNEVYPIVGFGNFYITGYGRTQNGGWQGGQPDDPATRERRQPPERERQRAASGRQLLLQHDLGLGALRQGRDAPRPSRPGAPWVLRNPEASFQPCVAVLVVTPALSRG